MTRIAMFVFRLFLTILYNVWMLLVFLTVTSVLLLANHYWSTLVACYEVCANFGADLVRLIQNF